MLHQPEQAAPSVSLSHLRLLSLFFFFSGASSLVFETIFTRLLTYAFGNTAHAVSTVLAAFLGGLALGAFLVGRWADRHRVSLRTYAILELLAGVYCLFVPLLFSGVTRIYVGAFHALNLHSWSLTLVRFGLSAAVILLPTMLMGGTLPVLARCVEGGSQQFQSALDRLYAFNTLGAALGTLASTYFLMPSYGVRGTLGAACSVNVAIFLGATIWSRQSPFSAAPLAPPPSSARQPGVALQGNTADWGLLAGAFFVGAAALSYEVLWTHLLAFLIGNTVYAFGAMLFTFLCGLGWGAYLVGRHLRRPVVWAWGLTLSQLMLGAVVLLSLPVWNHLSSVFAQGPERALEFDLLGFALLLMLRLVYLIGSLLRRAAGSRFSWPRVVELVVVQGLLAALLSGQVRQHLGAYPAAIFVAEECLRFLCAFYPLIVPCLFLGLTFPLLLNLATQRGGGVGTSVGKVYAANTLGSVAGSVVTGFAALPVLGSLSTLRAAATVSIVLGWGFALYLFPLRRARRWALTLVLLLLVAPFWWVRGQWDASAMTRGSYVYFSPGWPVDRVLYFQEDAQGGLTSVVEVGSSRVLLSNGKFQGNNTGEVGAQARFALIPMLFTHQFDRALVIGLGTGNTLRVVAHFPFARIDVAEIAPRIVEAARQWFQDVNEDVFDRDPRVKLSIADGRNLLLLSRQRYDLITIEITSIWMSGEADLYNQDFYELCRAHLTEQGILQQWVQLHHMRTEDLLVILNTAARVFPHMAFFLGPEQGLLIASRAPLACDYRQVENWEGKPAIRRDLDALGLPSYWSLLGELVLYGQSFQNALAALPRLTGPPADAISTDDRPYLEYQTPKGNTPLYASAEPDIRFLSDYRPPPIPPDLVWRGVPSDNERNLLAGYIQEACGDAAGALESFRKVGGASEPRAALEIRRLQSANSSATPPY